MGPLSERVVLPCGATLANRLAKAAMSEQLADRCGRPGGTLVALYERWGASGSGLLVSGNVIIDAGGTSEPRQVVLGKATDRAWVRQWTAAATHAGAHFWAQLNHAGGQTPRFLHRRSSGPSRVSNRRALGSLSPVVPLSSREIGVLVTKFGEAAEVALESGFTGVQVHAAHGYLISQFLSAATNTRTDGWGGSEERRRRFLMEVIEEVRSRVGPQVPVGIKLSASDFRHGGVTPEDAARTLSALKDSGIDLVEVSGGTFESPAMLGVPPGRPRQHRDAYFLDFVEASSSVMPGPVMLTGGFASVPSMRRAVDAGVDVIGLARPFVLDPHLARVVLEGTTQTLPRVRLELRGPQLFRAATEIGWHTREMERRALGEDTISSTSRPWLVGARYLAGQVRDSVR